MEGPGSLRLTSEKGRVGSVVPSGGGQGLNWGGDWAQWLVLPCGSCFPAGAWWPPAGYWSWVGGRAWRRPRVLADIGPCWVGLRGRAVVVRG